MINPISVYTTLKELGPDLVCHRGKDPIYVTLKVMKELHYKYSGSNLGPDGVDEAQLVLRPTKFRDVTLIALPPEEGITSQPAPPIEKASDKDLLDLVSRATAELSRRLANKPKTIDSRAHLMNKYGLGGYGG